MMIKKILLVATIATSLITILSVQVQAEQTAEVKSLRGNLDIDSDSKAPENKRYNKDGTPIARDYVQQPPLIPHTISGYIINKKSNKCLSCHSWKNYLESGATKISQTHFEDREKHVLANVSARRYFCTQCHVPQVNAPPLVENKFQPVTGISGK